MSWEKLTQDITFYAFFVASKTGKTGLTVTIDIWENTRAGTATEIVTGGSATEIGDGLYKYRLTSSNVDAIGEYIAVFKTADTSVDQQHIPALWIVGRSGVENLDAAISSRNATAPLDASATQTAAEAALTAYDAATAADVSAISVPSAATISDAVWDEALSGHAVAGSTGAALSAAGGAADPLLNLVPGSYASGTAGYILGSINPAQVTVTSPVATDGTSITVVRGDDYLNTDGRALTFTGATWPTLTAGTVALIVDTSGTPTSYSGVITAATSCYVELTTTQTTALSARRTYDYDLQATLSNGSIVTLVQGTLLVVEDIR